MQTNNARKMKKKKLKYISDKKSFKVPHVIYADLECLLRDIELCEPNNENSYTLKRNVHIPSGYVLQLVRNYDKNLTNLYRGLDCISKFVKTLKKITMKIANTKQKRPNKLTGDPIYEFNRSKHCHICKNKFTSKPRKYKVRDFYFYSGNYRGTAHKKCVIYDEVEIPIVFQNNSLYDNHFIMNELAKQVDGLKWLGKNSEKYISFKALLINEDELFDREVTCKLKFIDSCRFMMDSLDNLTNNLSQLNECKNCKEECNNYTRKKNVLVYQCKKCNKKSCKQ